METKTSIVLAAVAAGLVGFMVGGSLSTVRPVDPASPALTPNPAERSQAARPSDDPYVSRPAQGRQALALVSRTSRFLD